MIWWRTVYFLCLVCIIGLLASCAGPYNAAGPDAPFSRGPTFSAQQPNGPTNSINLFLVQKENNPLTRSPAQLEPVSANISFSPDKMLFSYEIPLVITIKSATPLSSNYEIIASLNGVNIAHQAKTVITDRQVLSLYFDSTYFQKKLDYTFTVFFRNTSREPWSHAVLEEVPCSLSAQDSFYFPEYRSGKYAVLSYVELMSRRNNLNPSLVYGLINQESSFNPKAFSPDMAVGLTQMTIRAARQVAMAGPGWPVYEDLESLPFIEGKFLIETGQIHDDMDWRLRPEKSIEGGIAYLRYLSTFWSKYLDNLPVVSSTRVIDREKSMCNLVLASYNLGPSRLKNILSKENPESQQTEWNKIRPYLRAIKTDSFQTSRGHYEKTPLSL
ncbi:MAG: transglycosylase SLT domain-containing protein [Bdellovibrio sp.]|nr:transglycosylase SLT domain-containing protein [Bdellovibrio sp.]